MSRLVFPLAICGAVVAAFLALHGAEGPPLADSTLAEILRGSSLEGERALAAMELGARKRGTAALRMALSDRSPKVRFEAAAALARQGNPTGLDELAVSVSDQDRDRRLRLVASLGFLEDPRAQELLSTISKDDPDPEIREIARRLHSP